MTTRYPPVRGLERGLSVMQALSVLGEASVLQISEETGLPRPTVHRLLETLRRVGYVVGQPKKGAFRLSVRVRGLAEGCKDDDWIAEIADRALEKLCDEVVWPTDIATYEYGAMVIRRTTHRRSPLSIQRVSTGRRVSMTGTALGNTYLAFCSDSERQAVLDTLKRLSEDDRKAPKNPAQLERKLEATRKRGYGLRIRGAQPKTSSIAVPVMHDGRVLACVNIQWIDSAIKAEVAVQRYLQPLRKAAARIADNYARLMRTRGEE